MSPIYDIMDDHVEESPQTSWTFEAQDQRNEPSPGVQSLPSTTGSEDPQGAEVDEPYFPTFQEATDLNKQAIGDYHRIFGDSPEWGGVLKPNELGSALASAQQHYHYGPEKDDAERYVQGLGKMAWRIAGNQVFSNGNKRSAYHLTQYALDQSGLGHLSPIEQGDPEFVDHLIDQDREEWHDMAQDPRDWAQDRENRFLNMWKQRYVQGGPTPNYVQKYPTGTYISDPQGAQTQNLQGFARRSNILDSIHNELSPLVFDNPASEKPILKPAHAHWIKKEIYATLDKAGYTDVADWLSLILTGSICTYQYSNDSDIDVSLFVDSRIFPEWSRAEMIALMVDKMDGRMLPGTQFPMQDFVVGEGIKPSDLYKPGLRSGYNIDNGKWIVPPERSQAHDVKTQQNGFYTWALQMADKAERLIRYEQPQAVQFLHQIHARRARDMRAGKGNFSESNIVWKFLANRGLVQQMADLAGEHIAKTAGEPTKPPHLRKSTSASKNCLSCKMYHKSKGDKGKCWGYGEYEVRADQLCDSYEKETGGILHMFSANMMQYDRDQHPEGKGFMLDDGSVWTWPTENLKPMHMQYSMKAKQQGQRVTPGSAFAIKEGKVWQYGPGRSLSPDQQQTIFAADPKLEMAPPPRQEQLQNTPGFGHGQNVLDILERESSWIFQSASSIHEVAWSIYEKALSGEGSTINLRGESPHTRYGFAPDLATQTPFPLEAFTPADVESFIQRFSDRLQDPEKFIGSWIEGNQIILDVSEGHDSYDVAHQRAWDGHQRAMWDSQNNEEVPVRGLDYSQPVV